MCIGLRVWRFCGLVWGVIVVRLLMLFAEIGGLGGGGCCFVVVCMVFAVSGFGFGVVWLILLAMC